jgi:hypothetical protein
MYKVFTSFVKILYKTNQYPSLKTEFQRNLREVAVGIAVTQERAQDHVAGIGSYRILPSADFIRYVEPIHIKQVIHNPQMIPLQTVQCEVDNEIWAPCP